MLHQIYIVILIIGVVLLLLSSATVPILRLIYLIRFPLLISLALVVLPKGANGPLAGFLGNIFMFDQWWEVAAVVLMTILVAWTVMYTFILLLKSIPRRFPDATEAVEIIRRFWRKYKLAPFNTLIFLILAVPTIQVCILSFEDSGTNWRELVIGLLAAFAGAGLILLVAHLARKPTYNALVEVRRWLASRFKFLRGFVARFEFMDWMFNEDVEPADKENFRHEGAIAFLVLAVGVYIAGYFALRPDWTATAAVEAPVVAYVLLLLMTLGWLLSGLGFVLDTMRVPTSLVLLLLILWVASIANTDHYYAIYPAKAVEEVVAEEVVEGEAAPAVAEQPQGLQQRQETEMAQQVQQTELAQPKQELPTISEAISNRADVVGDDSYDVMVVVMTSGGGIQASLWTAKVLTGLQHAFDQKFANSIGLISGVSGGGVGAMYYVDAFTERGAPEQWRLDDIVKDASKSTLGPITWGLVYPDLWRLFIWPPWAGANLQDRGWAAETIWNARLLAADTNAREKAAMLADENGIGASAPITMSTVPITVTTRRMLRDWAALVEEGLQPPTIFNSTEVQTGNRFLFTSFKVPYTWRSKSFHNTFPNYDVSVATAARMASTFPYVSPVAQAMITETELITIAKEAILPPGQYFLNAHLADGGYFDNDGVVSALEWLEYNIKNRKVNKPRILFIHITAGERFVPSEDSTGFQRGAELHPKGNGPAWLNEFAGPLLTVINSSGIGSQLARGPLDIRRFTDYYSQVAVNGAGPYEFLYTVFDLKGSDVLSWQLSQAQYDYINGYWCDPETTELVTKIQKFLGPEVTVVEDGCP